ncbi:hypothetical protein M422DRAFT_251681 [Sphaerobolus stellatus SS14]|uniref:Uncharacterized protein n=1 Tax=Sphaerobolus stellatus (strain SS14) TaxID=990650 RepID=A0A0C9VRJ2_SPHS4|nr:hypothetical protein M422DRAFT_251681 [Sphaerobolus stellatus SS14]
MEFSTEFIARLDSRQLGALLPDFLNEPAPNGPKSLDPQLTILSHEALQGLKSSYNTSSNEKTPLSIQVSQLVDFTKENSPKDKNTPVTHDVDRMKQDPGVDFSSPFVHHRRPHRMLTLRIAVMAAMLAAMLVVTRTSKYAPLPNNTDGVAVRAKAAQVLRSSSKDLQTERSRPGPFPGFDYPQYPIASGSGLNPQAGGFSWIDDANTSRRSRRPHTISYRSFFPLPPPQSLPYHHQLLSPSLAFPPATFFPPPAPLPAPVSIPNAFPKRSSIPQKAPAAAAPYSRRCPLLSPSSSPSSSSFTLPASVSDDGLHRLLTNPNLKPKLRSFYDVHPVYHYMRNNVQGDRVISDDGGYDSDHDHPSSRKKSEGQQATFILERHSDFDSAMGGGISRDIQGDAGA